MQYVPFHPTECGKLAPRIGCRLLTQLSQIQSHVQISKPVDSIFDEFAENLSPYENIEDRLVSKAIRIPKLQYLANNLLSQRNCAVNVGEAFELIRAAVVSRQSA